MRDNFQSLLMVLVLLAIAVVCGLLVLVSYWIYDAGKPALPGPPSASPTVAGETSIPPISQPPDLPPAATDTPADTTAAPATESPTFTPLPPTDTPPLLPTPDAWVEERLAAMSLEEKIGQMLLLGVDGQGVTGAACQQVQAIEPGGIIYRGGNVTTPEQLRTFSVDLQECASDSSETPLWFALDHEGQYVHRFASGATLFPAAMAQGAADSLEFVYQAAQSSGVELAFSGVNMVLGPVADVLTDYDNTVISQRSFGGNPDLASQFVVEAVRGYLDAGLVPVLKHFPGHGGVSGDTHSDQPVDQADRFALETVYLPPFASGIEAGAPVVMFSHVAFPAITGDDQPATLSPGVVALLREELGFQGVILTDSMGMGAITGRGWTVPEASLQAVKSGVDMLLLTSPESAAGTYRRLLAAVEAGELPVERVNEAVRRILSVKSQWGLHESSIGDTPQPDWNADEELAFKIGRRAVTLYRDDAKLVPLPEEVGNVLIIGPTDGWGLYPALGAALDKRGIVYNIVTYSNPWSGAVPEAGYLDTLPAQAAQYDLTLMLTWEAHLNRLRFGDNWQIELTNRLLATGNPVIVAALKSPTDILEFPQAATYLATFGTTYGQVQGLADVLTGEREPSGENPLPGLP